MNDRNSRGLLAAVVFVVLFAQVLLYPGVDVLVAALGAETTLDASMWFLAAEFAAFVAFAGVWGAASDATGTRRPFIVAGAVGGACGYLLLAALPGLLGPSFWVIILLRVLQGAATIGAFSLAMTMLMDLGGGHGLNMGSAGIAIGSGMALGAPVGGTLYEFGPLVPLYVAALLLVAAAFVMRFVPDSAPDSDGKSIVRALVGLRATPSLGLPYAFGFLDRLTAGFFALIGTLYFRTAFGLGPGMTGMMLSLFFAPFALLQYPFGALSDRIGRTIPVVLGSALYGLGVIAVGRASALWLAGLGMVSVGILGALMAPATMALVTDLADSSERGVAMAGFNVVGSLGFLAGIVVGGLLTDAAGFKMAFAVVGGLEVAVALVTIPVFLRLQFDRSETFAR